MENGLPLAESHRLSSLVENFRDKKYRDSYVVAHTRRFLARQMRKFRGERSQSEFGQLIGKRQTVVSRLEDPSYGKWTLQTLFDVAAKLNVAIFVRFVDFPDFLKYSDDMSDEASEPVAYRESDLKKMLESSTKPGIAASISNAFLASQQPGTPEYSAQNDNSNAAMIDQAALFMSPQITGGAQHASVRMLSLNQGHDTMSARKAQ